MLLDVYLSQRSIKNNLFIFVGNEVIPSSYFTYEMYIENAVVDDLHLNFYKPNYMLSRN